MTLWKQKMNWHVLIIVVIATMVVVLYQNSHKKSVPTVFSSKDMLNALWQRYKDIYLEKGTGRTLDKQRDFITTSEGESYTMLRSVWLDDKETFDKSLKWSEDNLKQKNSNLFSWLFGRREDSSYGILYSNNGQNTASDADSDIALALAFAYKRWGDQKYLDLAKLIIKDIWDNEIIIIKGRPYLAADNVEKNYSDNIVVNPSYLSPYAYRIFATIDPDHPWNKVVDSSYEILEKSMALPLDKDASAFLPANWVTIDKKTGAVAYPISKNLNTNYSYDALRVPWRIALDLVWYKEPRAQKILTSLNYLNEQWNNFHAIFSDYSHDGSVISNSETPAMYGGSLAALLSIDLNNAKDLYETKLLSLYNADTDSWKYPLSYYDDNWAWFGMALYNGQLPNLWDDSNTK